MLPEDLVFSQSSLQDYDDCPRRFELRYMQHCRWPAPSSQDALLWEQVTGRGFAFHRLLRQSHSGISDDILGRVAATDPDLLRWWNAYRQQPPADVPNGIRLCEATLQARIDSHRIEARFDLLAGNPGRHWLILDWKTNAHRSERSWLTRRLQSRVYPWVLVSAGQELNGGTPILPEQVEMCYWFAEFPAQPERLPYSAEQYEADGIVLSAMIAEIAQRSDQTDLAQGGPTNAFPRTENLAQCRFCVYRSLCWDNIQAGKLSEAEDTELADTASVELDMDALTPIPF